MEDSKRKRHKPKSEKQKETFLKIKRNNMKNFWMAFSKYFRPWLRELTEKYKARGDFPLMACWILPSYYTNLEDVEIAAYASMLIKDDDKLIRRVDEFRRLIGESPSEWFKSRGFVQLSIGANQDKRTGGVVNKRIAEYFGRLYECWPNRQSYTPLVFEEKFGRRHLEILNLLRLVLCTSDGIGRNVWNIAPTELKPPATELTKKFIKTFLPDYKSYRDMDMVYSLFCLEFDYDLFYSALAWDKLCRTRPADCSRFVEIYQRRYKEANVMTSEYWIHDKRHGILLDIDDF